METKYGKYIIKKPKAGISQKDWGSGEYSVSDVATRVAFLDGEALKGAFYFECLWRWKPSLQGLNVKAHVHDFDEIIAFFGTNPEKPFDLCGEVDLWLGDEKHRITESCTIFVPCGLKHGPLLFNRVDRPIFYLTTGTSGMYEGEKK
jgi:hypothetical protein